MSAVRVREYERQDRARWEAFVERSPQACFSHRIGWRELIERCFGHRTHYLMAERGGELVGVLPLAVVRSLFFGSALVSLPFFHVAGVAADDEEAAQALQGSAEALGRIIGVDHLELRNPVPRAPLWPRQALYAGFRKALSPDPEANLQAIPRKQRAMVRKGIKNGLTSQIDAGVERFFPLYAESMHRHGTPPLPRGYFTMLLEVFGADAQVLTVVDGKGRALSSVLSYYFRDQVIPYYAGERKEARDLAANDFKYWELMRRACERGVRVFDYGRSKRGTGSYEFKKNWGFEPAPLAYEYCLYKRSAVPENNPLNPKYRALIGLWRRLPLPVVNILGPHLAKALA